jgi:membrane protease YdiL (CAAX protease family)
MIARILRSLANPEAETPPWGPTTALAMPLLVLVALIFGSVITLSLLGPAGYAPLIGWIIGSSLAAAYIYSAFRRDRVALRLGPTNARLFVVLLFALGMAVLIDLIDLGITGSFLPAPELRSLVGADAGFGGWLAALLFMLVTQPLAEELAFRGVMYPSVRRLLGGWGSLLACAIGYGLLHLIAYTSTPDAHLWHTLVTPTLHGLVISAVRASTRSTRAAIIAHVGVGIFALLKLLALGL